MPALANPRHERFCQEYLVDLNGGRAYERAGYKAKGDHADQCASALLSRNLKVAARVSELQAARADRLEVTVDDVVRGLHAEATDSGNPGSVRVAAWAHLGKHVGAFEADNRQRAANILVDLTGEGGDAD